MDLTIYEINCKHTWISGSATTYCLRSLSPNARETARTPPTLQVPVYNVKLTRDKQDESINLVTKANYKVTLPAHMTKPPASSILRLSSV